jgi:hypothetical protein
MQPMGFLKVSLRALVIAALGLWLGGFTLYTAFVIRIGHRLVPGGRFGFVTAQVTSVLDVMAALAAVAVTLNLISTRGALAGGLKWTSIAAGLLLLATVPATFSLHAQLMALLDLKKHDISDPARFRTLHERYEMAATVQWGLGLLNVWLALAGWRRQDSPPPGPAPSPAQ